MATLSFPPCSTLQCVTIAITDDSIPEPDESFSLILERSPGLDSRITLASSTGSVLILDDDGIVVVYHFVTLNYCTLLLQISCVLLEVSLKLR